LIIICGIILLVVVIAATASLLSNLRDRDLAEKERTLESLALVLAEQIDRSFQSIELIQTAVVERMQSLGVASAEDLERQMSSYDTHQDLKRRVSALPHINAIVLTDSSGKLINFSRSWPVPPIKIPDQDPHEAFNADSHLTSYVGKPLRSPTTENWVVPIARKFSGPNGAFLGVVTGVMELQYFEQMFQAIVNSPNGSISLFRRDGTLLVRHPRQEAAVGQSFPKSMFIKELANSDHGTHRVIGVIDGQERLVSSRGLAHYPVALVVTTTVADALANWKRGAITMIGAALIIGLVIGGAVVLCVWLVGKKLREQSLQRDTALNNMSHGLVMFDSAARLVVCNDRYRQIYNLPANLVKPGCTVLDLLTCRIANGTFSGNLEEYVRDLLATIAQGKMATHVVETGDGRITTVVNHPMAGGGWVATHEDITERKHAEEQRRRTQKFLDTIIEHVPAPILVKDIPSSAADASQCRYSLINRACEELLGVSRTQIIGKTIGEIYPKERADFIIAENNETLRSQRPIVVSEHVVHTPGNGIRLATAKSIAVRDDDGKVQYLLTVLDDVTERRRAEQRIVHMAHYDILTDLPNRAAFNECFAATLERAAANNEQFAILSVDLDRFKEVNDLFGHSVGDALLREVTRRLQAAAAGAFLARVGGDEFTLIATDGAQPAAATALAERLLAAFIDDFEVEGRRLQIGLSIGGAVYPTDGTDPKTLMVNADTALYRAKAETRGSLLFFEPEMSARLGERLTLQGDLRLAIARCELLLHYQPQVQMTGDTIGFEALLRWQCPKRGMVSPGTFIPIAEESGLINSIGEWVLREACREAASWPQPLTVAVNVSPIQFRHGDLPSLVHSILLETGLAPARLELEITEGVLINDFSRAVAILRRLKSLGVQIALDDFGTGYSSLSYLHSFAFDRIKIDRTFIGDLEHNRHSMAIVRAVIGLGHSLDIPVLAEGAETEIQHAFLVQEGCDAMQGYLTGRPLPIADYAKLIGRQVITQKHYATAG
jgi:diguanylate cyclase (GGDEF)-like protein/PAS domain S-box-containing protein